MLRDLVKPIFRENADDEPKAPKVNDHTGLWLNCNENPYGVSKLAVKAMQEAVADVNLYPEPLCKELKKKLANHYHLKPENFAVANGSSGIIDALGSLFINPGDSTIFCQPTFMIYDTITKSNHGKSAILPLTKDMKYDLNGIRATIDSTTKMICICNPNNPTGTLISKAELTRFIKELPDHIVVLMDEAYIDFSDGRGADSMIELIDEKPVVVVRTFSKICGLAGVRIGYAIASEEMIRFINSRLLTFNVNKVALAGASALLDDQEYLDQCYFGNRECRAYLENALSDLGFEVFHSQTNFVYALTHDIDDAAVNAALLEKNIHINLANGTVRVSVGTMKQNEELIAALKEILR